MDNENTRPPKALLVEDEGDFAQVVSESLAQAEPTSRIDVVWAKNRSEALTVLDQEDLDVVLTDVCLSHLDEARRLEDTTGFQTVAEIRAKEPDLPIVVMTGRRYQAEGARLAFEMGARDFREKDDLPTTLQIVRLLARERYSERVQRMVLNHEMGMIGSSQAIVKLREDISTFADWDLDVLILGETGTGKELVARALTQCSKRKRMIPVNCAELRTDSAQAALFGVAKGAFTGVDSRIGYFQAADKGVLFLDEIGSLDLGVQSQLLRVVEDRRVSRQGEPTKIERVDIRIVAATSEEEKLKPDLYERLNQLRLEVPPLRLRLEDIPELTQFFIARYSYDFKKRFEIDDSAIERLQQHHWPRNIRELANVLARLCIAAKDGRIRAKQIRFGDSDASKSGSGLGEQLAGMPLPDALIALEQWKIEKALTACGGRVRDAARVLGVAVNTLYSKMRKYGVTEQDNN